MKYLQIQSINFVFMISIQRLFFNCKESETSRRDGTWCLEHVVGTVVLMFFLFSFAFDANSFLIFFLGYWGIIVLWFYLSSLLMLLLFLTIACLLGVFLQLFLEFAFFAFDANSSFNHSLFAWGFFANFSWVFFSLHLMPILLLTIACSLGVFLLPYGTTLHMSIYRILGSIIGIS